MPFALLVSLIFAPSSKIALPQHQKKPIHAEAAKPVGRPLFDNTLPITITPPRNRFEGVTPLPGAPQIIIDRTMTGGGLANQVARAHQLQARIIWVDGTANIERVNTEPKIVDLVRHLKDAGFNTIVFDVKPISGETLYPSRYAPKMLKWRNEELPATFDPLRIMSREARASGLSLFVSLNAFSEGHQLFHVGPGYDHPDQQTVLYEPRVILSSPTGSTFPCSSDVNVMPDGASEIGIFTNARSMPKLPMDGAFAISLGPRNRVLDGFEGGGTGKGVPTVPLNGAVLIGRGLAGDFLRQVARPGALLPYTISPILVPIGERPKRQIPLMMNPSNPTVQNDALNFVREVVSNYSIDGVIYDDRLRYAGLDADFSPASEAAFEAFVGHHVSWPESVYTYAVSTNMRRGIVPGPEWDAWLTFRALTIRNYLSRVRATLKATRPDAQLGVYTGSWYGEYPSLGSNWGSNKLDAGFWFLNPAYRATGFANLVDFMITGCYYPIPTMHAAWADGAPLGQSVEAAGDLTNSVIRDSTWCYAGIALCDFKDDPEGLMNALSAACSSTQGVMVFDLSHDIEPMWPVFARAFSSTRKPPHRFPGWLTRIRDERRRLDKAGAHPKPVVIIAGANGAGQ